MVRGDDHRLLTLDDTNGKVGMDGQKMLAEEALAGGLQVGRGGPEKKLMVPPTGITRDRFGVMEGRGPEVWIMST